MFLLYFLSVFVSISAVSLPDYIKLCSRKDPEFNKCVGKNMGDALLALEQGNKNLGVPILNPFYIEKMDIPGSDSGSVRLSQKYSEVNIYGMHDGISRNVRIDLDKGHWEMDVLSPKLQMLSKYEMTGQLLLFPINGKGASNTTMVNLEVHYDITFSKYQNKGKTHIRFDKIKMTMKPEKVFLDFKDIIPGNEQMSNELSKTMNENSMNIFEDVRPAFEDVFQQIFKTIGNNVFSKVPEEMIFLD